MGPWGPAVVMPFEKVLARGVVGVQWRALAAPTPSFRDRWLCTMQPRAWAPAVVAAALGQALGVAAQGRLDVRAACLSTAAFVCQMFAMTLLAAWHGRADEGERRRLFPETTPEPLSSPHLLDAKALARAGWGAAALALAFSSSLELVTERGGLTVAMAAWLALLGTRWVQPVALDRRGAGEVVQMAGLGFALPWWHAYAQSGVAMPPGLVFLPAFALLTLAAALASGLSDETADRWCGKTTFVTRFGGAAVRQGIEGLLLACAGAWMLLPLLAPRACPIWTILPAVCVLGVEVRAVRRLGCADDIETYHGLTRYRHQVDRAVVRSCTVLTLTLLVDALLVRGGVLT